MSGYLTLVAYWSEEDDADRPADACKPFKMEDTILCVVNFRPDNPEMPAILRDLRRFDLEEVADSRPKG
jgi:hypothetical protein